MITEGEVQAGLEALVASVPELAGGTVEDVRRLSGGASRETWSVDVVGSEGTRELILQRARPGAVPTGPDMRTEARLLRAARRAGVPVPTVVDEGEGTGTVGAPYLVVERVSGETIPRRILRDEVHRRAREALVPDAARALAAIHRIPEEEVPGLAAPDQVAQFRELLDILGEPHPAFELAFRWLQANQLTDRPRTVVHGDFRLGNLLVGDGELRAVLDWELAHAGDPMEDLGWLCVRAWRFGGTGPVAGLAAYATLFDAYEAAGGAAVDPDVVRWWEIMGTLKWGIMCIIQAQSHLSGVSRSVELATIGRRTCENEYDLLTLLP